jgi:hypothetical protein
MDRIWAECADLFIEKKYLYHLANNVIENSDENFLKIAENVFKPFDFAEDLGVKIIADYSGDVHKIDVYLKGKDVVPSDEIYLVRDKDIKTREFSKKRFWEIYQDYACSILLRVANQYFSFFSFKNEVILNAHSEVFDSATGSENTGLIIAVLLIKSQFSNINLDLVDPSSCLAGFDYHADFNSQNGYRIIVHEFDSEVGDKDEISVLKADYIWQSLAESAKEENELESFNESKFCEIIRLLLLEENLSTSYWQRILKIDYDSVSKFLDLFEASGLVAYDDDDTKVRKLVLDRKEVYY